MSTGNIASAEIRRLFLQNTPFLDVRAEIEFEKAAFPGSKNLPILKTDERHRVGVCYKERGQNEAVKLGHEIVTGSIKRERVEAWCQFMNANPEAHLYCWRGGMRSNLTRQWMNEAGVDVPLVPGGYKALRKVLLDEFEAAAVPSSMIIIAGNTGVAKTKLINECDNGIDLEGIAHHRGSSFGRHVKSGPTQGYFENRLGIDILKKRVMNPDKPLILEDEGRMVGPVVIPLSFWNAMTEARIARVDMPLDYRVQRILQEYVCDMLEEHIDAGGEQGFENFHAYLTEGLLRIKKRLGGERHSRLNGLMLSALSEQRSTGSVTSHEAWISGLLTDYYDPMYEYQLGKKKHRVVYTGDYSEVVQWAAAQK